jgi:3',5'-cyclic AMP phosphodiesterase CpdA
MRTLVHLSDLHFGRVVPEVLEPLRRAVHGLRPHLVVVSGDLTQRARRSQFREAREFLATLPTPQLVVPGNHDVPLYNVFRRFLTPLAAYKDEVTADLEPRFVDAEIAVIGVNTARSFVFKGGRINEEQVAQVREAICGLPDSVTKIVVTHHPFDVPKGKGEEDQIVGRARMALDKLADCGADLLLSGHLHETHVGHTAERYPLSGVKALVVQAGTATSSRTRESPNSFNVLRIDAANIEVESLVYDGSEFRPAGTQRFHHDGKGWHHGTADANA